MSDVEFDNLFPGMSEPVEENLPDFVKDEPPQETPAEEPQPVAAGEPAEQPAPEEGEAPEKGVVYAGKYYSVEELEKGYREIRELQRHTAERAKGFEQRSMESEARAAQMERALREAVPVVQEAIALRQQVEERLRRERQEPGEYGYPEEAPRPPVPQTPPITPDMVRGQADQIFQQRMQQMLQFQQQQQQIQNQHMEATTAMREFFERHPEVEPESELDSDIADTILALNAAWESTGTEFDLSSDDGLDAAYEAARRPALRRVYEMNPQYIDSEEGRKLARRLASEIDGITQSDGTQPVGTSPLSNTPMVERGNSPAPSSESPLDEFDQAVAEYRESKRRRGSDVFFGGPSA